MIYFKTKVLFLFILISTISFSQKKEITIASIDSLVNIAANYSEINSGEFAEIDSLCDIIEKQSKSINYDEGAFISYLMLAETYRDFSLDKTSSLIFKMDELIEGGGIKKTMLLIRYNLIKGYFEGSKGNFLTEITLFLRADSIADVNNVVDAKRYINQNICGYYVASEEYDKAIVLARENMYDPSKDSLSYFVDIENVAILHSYIGNDDSAIYYLNKAISEGYGNFADLHYEYFSLGRAYFNLNELDSAKKYYSMSKTIGESKYQYTVDLVNLYNNIGMLYKRLNQTDSSSFYFKEGLKVSDSIGYIHGKHSAYRGIIVNELKDKEILQYFYSYEELKDTITNRNTKTLEKKLLIENETLKKEAKIKELELKKEADKNHKLLLYGILLLALIVFSFVIYRYVLSQKILKKNLEIEEYKKQQAVNELKKKEQELASKINIIQSNIKVIEELKNKELKSINLTDITSVFEQNYISDVEWQNIALQFNEIHPNYINSIKEDDISLTQNDIRLLILLKLEYSNQAIAEILNISVDGVKKAKYRLKKKVTTL